MQATGANVSSTEIDNLTLEKEATRRWLEMVKAAEQIEKHHHAEMDNLRRQMTHNYKCLMKEIEKSKEIEEAKHAEIAKEAGIVREEEAEEPIYDIRDNAPLPRVSISSSVVPPNEELYGY
jgi:hypothetical protein